jgi:hypothetical protein
MPALCSLILSSLLPRPQLSQDHDDIRSPRMALPERPVIPLDTGAAQVTQINLIVRRMRRHRGLICPVIAFLAARRKARDIRRKRISRQS